MFFTENPFYIEANPKKEEALTLSLEEARHILRQNGNRSEAEFYWPVGVPKETVWEWVEKVVSGHVFPISFWKDTESFVGLVLELNTMYYGGALSVELLLDMEQRFQALRPADVAASINRARKKAGYPRPCDASDIERWIQDVLYQVGIAFRKAMERTTLTAASERLFQMGKQGNRGMVYYQLLSMYEESSREKRMELEAELAYGLMILLSHPAQSQQLVQEKLEELFSLQKALYGRDGWWTYQTLCNRCRNRGITLYERKGKEAALSWVRFLLTQFAFDDRGKKQLENDIAHIEQGRPLVKASVPPVHHGSLQVPKTIRKIPDLPMEKEKSHHRNLAAFLAAVIVVVVVSCWLLGQNGICSFIHF